MTAPFDPVDLTRQLIACPSVTPVEGGAQALLQGWLQALGFTVTRFIDGAAPDGPVPNLLAVRGSGGPHLAFAGHSDVVPPGEGWHGAPFEPDIRGDLLYGRGAVDMKGAIAAAICAIAALPGDHAGTISLIITGDEEGPAKFGTVALMQHMDALGLRPDLILVGEPTSQHRVGDMVKIGRRGSVNMWLTVAGTQGHVAYPHLAYNPATPLVRTLARLKDRVLDTGNDWFQPSNLEITDIMIGNPATNVIPAEARARINIRFNNEHRGEELVDWVRQVLAEEAGPDSILTAAISGEAFLTPPGDWSGLITAAIRDETGIEPELSTTGGTSDARFLSSWCPVVEFGLCNATMHKLDEAVAVDDLHRLTAIYRRIFAAALSC
jgi:succinyl-diaminopimelate desuccinylase